VSTVCPVTLTFAATAGSAGAQAGFHTLVTDLFDEALSIASRMGATDVINVRVNESRLAAYMKDGGYFDAALETSGNPLGLETCIGATRAGGRIVQVGIQPPGQSAMSVNKLVAKELELVGTFLSNEEFRWAVDALAHGRIDVGPILTGEFLLADAINAFDVASDRSKAMKVSLVSGT
jgi:L-idonate 5-dehydrogenase